MSKVTHLEEENLKLKKEKVRKSINLHIYIFFLISRQLLFCVILQIAIFTFIAKHWETHYLGIEERVRLLAL